MSPITEGSTRTLPEIPWELESSTTDDTDVETTITNRHSQMTLTNDTTNDHQPTPLPKLQLFLLLLVQVAEPIIATVIYPFITELIVSLGVTNGDDKKTGHYVGVVESTFFACQCLTVMSWGRLSDRIGRRPVLMMGTVGMSISIICFGLSTSFPLLLISRGLCGVLNGNVGVVKAMMSEITDASNFDQAVSYMPIMWASGGTLGPLVGGSLSNIDIRFPKLFSSSFWRNHPYFVSCAASALFPISAFLLVLMFLRETAGPQKKAVGQWEYSTITQDPESAPESEDEEDNWDRRAASEGTLHNPDGPLSMGPNSKVENRSALPIRDLLTPKILSVLLNYACLALVDIAYQCVVPVFFSSRPSTGGLGLPPSAIGFILGAQGIISGIVQVNAYPYLRRTLGARWLYRLGISSFIITWSAFPIMHHLMMRSDEDDVGGIRFFTPALWTVLCLQQASTIIGNMCYGSIFTYIVSAAPSPEVMGSTSGLAQTVSAFMRTVGPAFATSLFAFSVEHNLLGGRMVYLIMLVFVVMAICATLILPETNNRPHVKVVVEEEFMAEDQR